MDPGFRPRAGRVRHHFQWFSSKRWAARQRSVACTQQPPISAGQPAVFALTSGPAAPFGTPQSAGN
eukprot:6407874-Pyramimonas_sp.AAC.1